jgi:hypothetical protein
VVASAGLVVLAAAILPTLDGAWRTLLDRMSRAPTLEVSPATLQDPAFFRMSASFTAAQLRSAAAMLLGSATLLFLARRWRAFVFGLPLLMAVELFVFAHRCTATIPADPPYPAIWEQAGRAAGEDRVRQISGRDPNRGMIGGWLELGGYDGNPAPRRYAQLLALVVAIERQDGAPAKRLEAVYRMLRCRYLLGFDRNGAPAVKALSAPLPRVALITRIRVLPELESSLGPVLDPAFDPAREVLLEREPTPVPEPDESPAAGTVRVLGSTTDTLELQVELGRAAILLVTDAYDPGWRVVPVGPAPQGRYEVLRADGVLRAVPLAAGTHRLRMEYAPAGFRLGRVISVVALGLYGVACGLWWRRGRPRSSGAVAEPGPAGPGTAG